MPFNPRIAIIALVLLLLTSTWSRADEDQGRGMRLEDAPRLLQPVRARTEEDHHRLKAAAMLMEARISERRGETAKALRGYQRAYRFDPDAKAVLKQIVPLAIELGRVGEATRYAMLLADTELDDPSLAERLAILLADQLRYDQSLRLYQRAITLQSEANATDLIAINFEMGRLYFLTDKHQQAAKSFRTVLRALDNPKKFGLSDTVRDLILAQPDLTYNLMAEAFLEAGDFEKARELFHKSAETKDNHGWLQLQLARVDFRDNRGDASRERLHSYIAQRFQFAGLEPYRILHDLIDDNDASEKSALETFRDWLADDPDNFPLLSFVAELSRKRGGLNETAELYERSLTKQPTIDAYRALIATYQQTGDLEKLITVLGKVTSELNGLDPIGGDVRAIIEDRDTLQRLFELGRKQLAADEPHREGISAACGLMAIAAKEYQVADEFLSSLEKESSACELFLNWGLELLIAGEHERATKVFQRCLDTEVAGNGEAVILYYLAGALQLSGETEKALTTANKAASLDRNNPALNLRPAWILYQAKRYDEAEASYRGWLEKFGDIYDSAGIRDTVRDARFSLSNICAANERHEEATEWLELVLDEFPEDVGAMNDLGYLMIDQGLSLRRAFKMIQYAVAAEPDNVAYLDSLGWALFRMGKYDEAVVELEKAVAGDDPDPIILDHLGDANLAAGRPDEAVKAWQKALDRADKDNHNQRSLQVKIKQKLDSQLTESK